MAIPKQYIHPTVTMPENESLSAAGLQMRDRNVGCVVVVDDEQHAVGLLTDRDIALAVLHGGASPLSPIKDAMSYPVVTLTRDESLIEAARRVRRHAVKRLPVCDADGKVIGIVTADDLIHKFAQELRWLSDGIQTGLHYETRPSEAVYSIFGKE